MSTVLADTQLREVQAESSWAFISFVEEDLAWCDWLYFTLHGYPVPTALAIHATKFGFPLPEAISAFPDPNDSAHRAQLSAALGGARYLIVVVSPHSAHSAQIGEHIRSFKNAGGEERIIALVVEGGPTSSSTLHVRSERREWLPRWLEWRLGPDGRFKPADSGEPVIIDARPGYSDLDEVMTTLFAALLDVRREDLEVLEALTPADGDVARASVASIRERFDQAAAADFLAEDRADLARRRSVVLAARKAAGLRLGVLLLGGAILIVIALMGTVVLRNRQLPDVLWGARSTQTEFSQSGVPTTDPRDRINQLRFATEAAIARAEILVEGGSHAEAAAAYGEAIASAQRVATSPEGGPSGYFQVARLCRTLALLQMRHGSLNDARRTLEAGRVALEKLQFSGGLAREREQLRSEMESALSRLMAEGN